MRVAAEARHLEANGLGETRRATILMGAKFTRIFSNQIYSDKPLAIVGELCANAWDSHRQANKADVPFVLKLPTPLEKSLRISDYGVGMTHDFMMEHFMVMLHSPKDQDDFAAGGFGLGRFTPLAYSDSFVVQCREAGQMRRYVVYKDDEGVPAISFVGTVPTLEADGVDVIMDIAEPDIDSFIHAAEYVAAFIEKPGMEIIGRKIEPLKWRLRKEHYGFFDIRRLPQQYADNYHVAIVGPRAYKLTFPWSMNVPSLFKKRRGVALFFDIGEVEITPSREALSYTPETTRNIEVLIEECMKVLPEELKEELNAKLDFLEAFQFWYETINDWEIRTRFGDEFVEKIEWNGVAIDSCPELEEPVIRLMGNQTIPWKDLDRFESRFPRWSWIMQTTDRRHAPKFVLLDMPMRQATVREYVKRTPKNTPVLFFRNIDDLHTFQDHFQLTEDFDRLSEFHEELKPKKNPGAVRLPTPVLVWANGANAWESIPDIEDYIKNHPTIKFYATETNREKIINHDNSTALSILSMLYFPNAILIGVPRAKKSLIRRLKLPDFRQYVADKMAALPFLWADANNYLDHQDAGLPQHSDEYLKTIYKSSYLSRDTRSLIRDVLSRERSKLNQAAYEFIRLAEKLFPDLKLNRWETPQWVESWKQLSDEFPMLISMMQQYWGISWWNYADDHDFRRAIHYMLTYITSMEAIHGCLSAD